MKSPETRKVSITPGDIITYNAHMEISGNTSLSFHVNLPYFQTPIMKIEKIEVTSKGKNLEVPYEVYTYAKDDPNHLDSYSQSSIDFGNVTRRDVTKPGDSLVVQVQARLLGRFIKFSM